MHGGYGPQDLFLGRAGWCGVGDVIMESIDLSEYYHVLELYRYQVCSFLWEGLAMHVGGGMHVDVGGVGCACGWG